MPDTIQEFAGKIKTKYPQYKDIPDEELTQKIANKYPQYKEQVQLNTGLLSKASEFIDKHPIIKSLAAGIADPSGGAALASGALVGEFAGPVAGGAAYGMADAALRKQGNAEMFKKGAEGAAGGAMLAGVNKLIEVTPIAFNKLVSFASEHGLGLEHALDLMKIPSAKLKAVKLAGKLLQGDEETIPKNVSTSTVNKALQQAKHIEGILKRAGVDSYEKILNEGEKLGDLGLSEIRDRVKQLAKASANVKGTMQPLVEVKSPAPNSGPPQTNTIPGRPAGPQFQQVPQQPLPKLEGKPPSGTIQGEVVQPQPKIQTQAKASQATPVTIPNQPASALGPKRDATMLANKDQFKSDLIKWAERQKSIPTQDRLEKTVWVREGKLNIKEALDTVTKRFTIP